MYNIILDGLEEFAELVYNHKTAVFDDKFEELAEYIINRIDKEC